MMPSLNDFIGQVLRPDPDWREALEKAMGAFKPAEIRLAIEGPYTILDKVEGSTSAVGTEALNWKISSPRFPVHSKEWWIEHLIASYMILELPDCVVWKGGWNQTLPKNNIQRTGVKAAMGGYLYCSCMLEFMEQNQLTIAEPNDTLVKKRVEKILSLIHDKSDDYGQSFRRFPLLCVTTRLWEKISRYLNILKKGETHFEGVEDTLADMIGWSTIGYALFFEE
jgi:hypothetical protein